MELKSNMSERISSLITRISSVGVGGSNHSKIARIASESILSEVVERIHDKGLASDGSQIGQYSKKPMYVSTLSNVGSKKAFGAPVGKTGVSMFKNGKKHTSRYFQGGYEDYKTAIGRNKLGSVNLSLSGQMQNQLAVMPTQSGWGIGFQNAELLKRAVMFETQKYKKQIWALSVDERAKLKQIITFEVRNAILRTNSN